MMRIRPNRTILLLLLALAACDGGETRAFAHGATLTGGDPYAGRKKARDFGCGACHTIPGVPGANALVGPPLTDVASRMYIAGRLTNTPQHMVRWIQDPPAVDSGTAMPNLGVSERDARDIAAYLYAIGYRREP
jgi:cytochrome c